MVKNTSPSFIKSIFDLEKKFVFLINFFLVLFMIITLTLDWDLELFFYFNIILTIIISYIYFKTSKKLSKTLILTNLFIFFYFFYPKVAEFLSQLLGAQSYIYILFYTIVLSYIFLLFSGEHKTYLGNISKFSFKLAGITILLGFSLGFLFFLIQEPVPTIFVDIATSGSISDFFKFIVFSSLIIGLSEQMIFSGFLHNSYRKITSLWDAKFQVAIIFVCFHLLRFDILVKHYYTYFSNSYILFITSYYILLFLFMVLAQFLYTFKLKNYEGNFFYPVLLHFAADLGLFLFYLGSILFL